nr:regulator [Vibrio nigripulchritudo]
MDNNYIFRQLVCGLSVEETAKLCFKSAREVKKWDAGKPIPPECKRLMRWYCNRELCHFEEWEGFRMHGNRMKLPTGATASPQQIMTGMALLEIQSELELKTTAKLLKYVKAIGKIKKEL